ncbi:MAG: hypothetical protein KDE27_22905, partial [Planctomycetes bacterium]|nr:hypothetical protein [Planctomycetota bacterium]
MNLDRDLRDALRPLRGDAVEDARAVLARLDGSSGPGAPRGPFGLPIAVVVLAVLALGVVVGVAVGRAFGGDGGRSEVVEPPPPGPATPPDDSPKEPPPKDPPPKDPRPKELPPMDEQGILLMAFGKVSIEEPKKPTETVAPGGWRVPMGTLFETGESLAGLYVYDSRAAIRLGKQTVAAVERDRIALRGGRLWLSTLGEPVAQRIETEAVVVLSHGAELVVDHAADGVAVIVLDGGATVRAAGGDARHLASMQRCTIDRTGMIGEVKPVPFAGEYVGWMAPMILQQQDDRELYSWLDELVAAYVEGSYRDAAATVLRRFEARAV